MCAEAAAFRSSEAGKLGMVPRSGAQPTRTNTPKRVATNPRKTCSRNPWLSKNERTLPDPEICRTRTSAGLCALSGSCAPYRMAAMSESAPARPHGPSRPSAWVRRFVPLVPAAGPVLDLACGGGRHSRLLLAAGHPVTAVDIAVDGLADLAGHERLEIIETDLEDGRPFPLAGRRFAGVVVTNYLHRPLLPDLVDAVAPAGLLIYETFARGNERFGKPRNPDHLLKPGELLAAVQGRLRVLAYEDLVVEDPRPAAVQRICARNEAA